jgi:membrane fusion protein, heavy metal efflux system
MKSGWISLRPARTAWHGAPADGRVPWRRAVLPLCALALAAACGGRPPDSGAAGQAPAAAGYFTVPAAQLPRLKMTSVARLSWPVWIRTTGTVDFNADQTTPVITQVSGPITRIVVDLGSRVKQGDPLLFVSSPDLSNAIAAYRKARNRLDLARRTLDRSRDLLAHKAAAQKDFEQAEADFNDASTDAQNALQALRIFGVAEDAVGQAERQNAAITPELAVRSPIAGAVVQKLASPGQVIQAGATTCFLVSNPATVWVQAHVFEHELTGVRDGDLAEIHAASLPDVFSGKVTYIGAMLDPATRTVPVRIVTENRGGLLKKDQFVDAVIHSRTSRDVLSVPVSAVLYNTENLPFVYVQAGPGRFVQRLIQPGGQRDGAFEVLSGVREGESVVAEGGLFLQFAEAAR